MALTQTHSNTLAFLLILSFDYIQVPVDTKIRSSSDSYNLLIFMQLHIFILLHLQKHKKRNKLYCGGPTTIKLSRSSSLEIQLAKAKRLWTLRFALIGGTLPPRVWRIDFQLLGRISKTNSRKTRTNELQTNLHHLRHM